MIFLWTSNGGPMQYIGLLAFFIQMIPYLTSQMDPAQAQYTLTAFLILGMTLTLLYALYYGTWSRLHTHVTRYIRFLERTTGIRNRALLSLLTCGGVFGITTLLMSSTIMDMSSLLSVLQMGVVFMVLKAQAQGGGARQQQHHRNPQQEQESKERRFAEISKIVQNMPIEEFMPPSSLSHSDTSCSLATLRQMLEHRGVSAQDQASFVERQHFVDALDKHRNYCETCCICCEDYQQGDPLRILPKCRHEFHVECVDQWAYTFANKNKRTRDPSCPLCNTPLE